MNIPHPSEKEIQLWALDKSGCPTAFIDHIESCAQCQAAISTYRILFSEIKQSPKPVFDFDLSALVLPQLPKARPRTSADRFVAGFLIVFVSCFIGIPVYLFRLYILNLFGAIPAFFVYAIIGSACLILLIKILDMYKKFRKQMHFLNFN